MESTTNLQRLSHIGICVAELERSVAFYRDVLGFQELSRLDVTGPESEQLLGIEGGELQAAYLERDGTRIELLYYPVAGHQAIEVPRPMNRVGFTHLSFRVADIDSVIAAARKAGGGSMDETLVDRPEWQVKVVFITDPDGLRIELLQSPGDPHALPGS